MANSTDLKSYLDNLNSSGSKSSWLDYVVLIVIILLILAITIFAIRGEFEDYAKFKARPPLAALNRKQRQDEYIFHICFPYDHLVKWRTIFLGSLIATFVIFMFFYFYVFRDVKLPLMTYLVIFSAIFVTFYAIFVFERHHFWRDACAKVRDIPRF